MAGALDLSLDSVPDQSARMVKDRFLTLINRGSFCRAVLSPGNALTKVFVEIVDVFGWPRACRKRASR
jgi:hypothetical protein